MFLLIHLSVYLLNVSYVVSLGTCQNRFTVGNDSDLDRVPLLGYSLQIYHHALVKHES